MKIPYSFAQGEKLCQEFQNLVGTRLENRDAIIETVVLTPFDEISKHRFFLYYLLFDNNAEAALKQEYMGLLYDVMIVARTPDDEIVHQDLHSWINYSKQHHDYSMSIIHNNDQGTQVYM